MIRPSSNRRGATRRPFTRTSQTGPFLRLMRSGSGSHLTMRPPKTDACTTCRDPTRSPTIAGMLASVGRGAFFELYPELKDVEPHPVEATAGTAVVHNGLIAHGTGANMTPRWRRAMTCQYMPDGATFNGNRCILSRQQLSRLAVGDVLDNENHNPLVWMKPRPGVS